MSGDEAADLLTLLMIGPYTGFGRLWPGLLAFALLLNLIELVMRKWRGILESFRGPRAKDLGSARKVPAA